jgi:hypothetical protein
MGSSVCVMCIVVSYFPQSLGFFLLGISRVRGHVTLICGYTQRKVSNSRLRSIQAPTMDILEIKFNSLLAYDVISGNLGETISYPSFTVLMDI